MQKHPLLIQGGMGIGISNWQLARVVSQQGQLGVVSGTGVEITFSRLLQNGDPDGHCLRALAHFPVPAIAQRVIDRYYIAGGKDVEKSYKDLPMFTVHPRRDLLELTICANFAEVWLAKEGHDGLVGINLLEKVQLPHLSALYGAMLAHVDYVLMGAGIPRQIPGALDALAKHEATSYILQVEQADSGDVFQVDFDPQDTMGQLLPSLYRPQFLAIISSATLARMLITKSTGVVNGFIIEGPTAGGHNAPPRGKTQLNERGEPIYGARDEVDMAAMRELGLPFWLAGSYASPEKINEALALGAVGIQAGTIFALCDDSGMVALYRQHLRRMAFQKVMDIYTDPVASPTQFPFKVANLPISLADPEVYDERPRICNIGRLRNLYKQENGKIGYRCPAEPVKSFEMKGGKAADAAGRKCLCNALMANIGLPQTQPHGYEEQPLITLGDDYSFIPSLMTHEDDSYTALDAIAYLLAPVPSCV